jgi:hypothetical protein
MASRKAHRKHKSRRSRSRRSRGGAALSSAPLAYSLAGDWSSKMSAGQGGDYLKYHVGQHGGALAGAPLTAIDSSALPSALRGPAHIGGLDRAFSDVAGLRDQAGGKRRRTRHKKHGKKHGKKSSKGGKRKSSKSSKRRRTCRTRKSNGGAIGYAPFGSASMLLDSAGYSKAGLTPQWSSGVEFDAAKQRQGL